MDLFRQLQQYPYLLQSYIAYVLLAVTDMVHHLHVALVLENPSGLHAVFTGAILLPLSFIMVWLYAKLRKKIFVWVFLAISVIAVLLPGLYHGGWDHLLKVLAFLRVESESTEIASLFPVNNINLWFYEITGMFEFFLGVVCAWFLYRFLSTNNVFGTS